MTREERLTQELVLHIAHRMAEEKLGLYPALRILGYTMVALAEVLDEVGENDDAANP